MDINQYDIILVNLDPTIGSEIRKTRPCVVLSPNEMNLNLNTIIIVPMTSKSRNYPTRVKIEYNQRRGWIVLDQIRTVDRKRVVRVLDQLKAKDIGKTKTVLKEIFID